MKKIGKIVLYSVSFVVITGVIGLGGFDSINFNNTLHKEEYASNELFEASNEVKTLDVSLKDITASKDPKNVWTTLIEDGRQESYEENNYTSAYMDIVIENNTDYPVTDYTVRMDVKTQTYMLTGWCGDFEFHQFRDGQEYSQKLNMLSDNKPTEDSGYTIDVIKPAEDYLVVLMPGDYFIYYPSAADGMVPLAKGQSINPGIIVYESMNEKLVIDGKNNRDLSSAQVEAQPIDLSDKVFNYTIKPRGDAWNRVVDRKNEGISEPNYIGQTYDFYFTNDNKYTIRGYSLEYKVETPVYLSSAWNGSIEIHQGSKTAYIEDLREFDAKKYDLEVVRSGQDMLIPLDKGDSFIYHPSEEFLETPLESGRTVTSGIIMYHEMNTKISASATIPFYFYASVWTNPLFICMFGFFVLWCLILLFDILLHIRTIQYEHQQEHDEKIIVESIETFTSFIDAKDQYTNGHSHRVAYYTRLIAEKMGYSEEQLKNIYYIALLHDCGKIGIPDSILSKPSRLTDQEFRIIKTHPSVGAEILSNFQSIEGIQDGVLYHHERFDGKGYPTGKSGKDIPEIARIICVADSFDAMSSDRCYRTKLTKEEIIHELENNRGTQFDPDIADIMVFLILSGKLELE